jgi:hypothetical protein
MTRHEVKTWPQEWAAVASGQKTGDLRFNDRGYQPGDVLVLLEWAPIFYTQKSPEPIGNGTGRSCERLITHVLPGGKFGLADGYVMLSLAPVPAGYIVAGEKGGVLIGLRLNPHEITVHPTKEAGVAERVECHAAGYTDWRLYAMTEVVATDEAV